MLYLLRVKLPLFKLSQFPHQHIGTLVYSNRTGIPVLCTVDSVDFIPYFLESTRAKNEEELYLKIQDINTREAALKLAQKEVWLPETEFKKYAAKSAPINLLGYMVVEDEKELGIVLEVIEQPHQVLCRIEISLKEVYIPINESTLLRIDHKSRKVFVALPEGLLEVYL